MSGQKPFNPLLLGAVPQEPVMVPTFYAQEAVVYQPPPGDFSAPAAPFGPGDLWCHHCKAPLRQGESCIELLCGVVGRGKNSGQATVVPDEDLERRYPGANNPVLCWDCAIPWLDQELYGGSYFDFWMDSAEPYRVLEEDEEDDD